MLQPGLAPGEPAPHRLDQVEDVVRGGPAFAAVVDRHRERRGQHSSGCQLPAASLCADEVAIDEAADHVLDGQRQGEEELVGLVVSAGQRDLRPWWVLAGRGVPILGGAGCPELSRTFAPVPGRSYGGMGLSDSGGRVA